MGFRFRKSIQIFPGIKLNISKSGLSLSLGPRGLKYTVNSSGRSTATVGIPGTGLSYSKTITKAFNAKKTLKPSHENMEENEAQVVEYQNYINYITNLHEYADEKVQWLTNGPSILPEVSADESAASHYTKLSTDVSELSLLSSQILEGNLEAYENALRAYLPLQDLAEFGSGFDIDLEDAKKASVSFELNLEEVLPKEKLSLTPTGKLSQKALPKGELKTIADDYIASASLRIALDLFALLPLEIITVIAKDKLVSPVTGHEVQEIYLDVQIDRKTLEKLNLETIDPSSALQNFKVDKSLLKL